MEAELKHQIYRAEVPKVETEAESLSADNELMGDLVFENTSGVTVPEDLIDQVIGQDEAVEVIKKAAHQRRHVMLIGSPGTGKSMLGRAMAELLPVEELQDVMVYPNPEDNNTPKVRVVPAGRGKQIVDAQKMEARKKVQTRNMFFMLISHGPHSLRILHRPTPLRNHSSGPDIPLHEVHAAQRRRLDTKASCGQCEQEEGTLCGRHWCPCRGPPR